MGAALDQLGADAEKITPVFVSVDPERDTAAVVASYIENFRDGFVGLTGTPAQVAAMTKAYRVYYAKVENQARPNDYQMDHSSILYLMGPDGRFVQHFTYTTDAKALADGLRQAIAN
jgi:cytochrome oxidase Cu insertion factor (SCO1/SenC/PrrC family)